MLASNSQSNKRNPALNITHLLDSGLHLGRHLRLGLLILLPQLLLRAAQLRPQPLHLCVEEARRSCTQIEEIKLIQAQNRRRFQRREAHKKTSEGRIPLLGLVRCLCSQTTFALPGRPEGTFAEEIVPS